MDLERSTSHSITGFSLCIHHGISLLQFCVHSAVKNIVLLHNPIVDNN